MLVVLVLVSGCSNGKDKESSSDPITPGLVKSTQKKGEGSQGVAGLALISDSEVGAKSFAFNIASAFVSTDIVQKDLFEKVISTSAKNISVDSILLRNKSTTLPRISFSPVGIALDKYARGYAVVAVNGLSFESASSNVQAVWKEIRMEISYNQGWKVETVLIIDIPGPQTDNKPLSSEFLSQWAGYFLPQNELISGDKSLYNFKPLDFGTVDENGVPVTFPPGE